MEGIKEGGVDGAGGGIPGKGRRKAEEGSRSDAKRSGDELEERMLMIIINKTIYDTIR